MVKERFYKTEVVPRCLTFKRPAGTSRGVYTTRKLWEVRIRKEDEPSVIGIGECAPLPDLSCDYGVDYEITLSKACLDLEQKGYVDTESLRHYPSILFGLEMAMRHYEQGGWRHYDTPFSRGQAGIPINGLIWMGDYKYMLEQVEEKMKEGFRCVKLKIGARFIETHPCAFLCQGNRASGRRQRRFHTLGGDGQTEAARRDGLAFHRAAYPCRAVGRNGTPCGRVTPSHRSRRGTDRL